MKTHLIIGPPGTGKTRYITEQSARAAERYGADRVLICSLTKAAARNAAGRNDVIPDECIGTLHSFAHRALGRPKLVAAAHVKEWNALHPTLRIGSGEVSGDLDVNEPWGGDEDLLRTVNLKRARLEPVESWPEVLQRFFGAWQDFKRSAELVDFTDLIDFAFDTPVAPGSPAVIFVDEAQDLSALELRLLRSWAQMCQSLVLVGDPLQAIFEWRGGDPRLLDPDSADWVHILDQSYRVPRLPLERARSLVRRLPGGDVLYRPTAVEGSVERRPYRLSTPEPMLGELRELVGRGESVMVLTTCGYMLSGLVAALRAQGIAYHNPYAPRRWSPFSGSGTSTSARIAAFLRPADKTDFVPRWTPAEVKLWAEMLRASVMTKGAKKRISLIDDEMSREDLDTLLLESFDQEALDALFGQDIEWLMDRAVARFQKAADYPLRVLRQSGKDRFLEELGRSSTDRPWVIVGTIHSVKGGEADNVFVFPDLSAKGYQQFRQAGHEGEDAIRRCLYVAMTRTRDRLVLCEPNGQMAVRL